MTLTLIVISFNGQPAQAPASMHFGAGVGTIGRHPGNTLVLPDPERNISRIQAEVIGTPSGQFVIRNVSAAVQMAVGNAMLTQGDSAVLAHDDLIRIGLYVLRVVLIDTADGEATGIVAPSSRSPDPTLADWLPPVESPPWPSPDTRLGTLDADDPFADLLARPPVVRAPDPLDPPSMDDLFAPAPAAQPVPADLPPAGLTRLPDDWDPFGLPSAAAPPAAPQPTAPGPTDPGPTASGPAPERAEISALVPTAVRPAQPLRIEVFLGPAGTLLALLDERAAAHPDREAADVRPLFTPLAAGTRIELTLECPDAQRIAPTSLALIWQGQTLSVNFQVLPPKQPEGPALLVDVNVFVEGVCIGHLPITLPYVQGAQAVPAAAPANGVAQVGLMPHRRVFMSYSSDDRAAVIEATRVLRRFGIEAFMDRLSLEGGEDWEPRLYRELEACDAFMLFWSAAAAESAWVLKETQCALSRQRTSADRRPKIVTHLLGPPPPASPPRGLEALHFNDPMYALWEASRSDGRRDVR
ncbi:TIR domain-containing protein [Aquabacterium humicola]|uniref:TIR domain-containing protein n=1 Tax=Aquabacterium humicola TaxID=3237377 RepID=UPI002542DE37|nr:TIR domain-containing protein [Rubrivivax pictus]